MIVKDDLQEETAAAVEAAVCDGGGENGAYATRRAAIMNAVKRYSWDNAALAYEAVYHAALARPAAAGHLALPQ